MRPAALLVCATATLSVGILYGTARGIQAAVPQHGASVADPKATGHRAELDRYCVTCHNARLKSGGVALDSLDVADVPAGAAVWERVIRKLRTGQMPPPGVPRPAAILPLRFGGQPVLLPG